MLKVTVVADVFIARDSI